MSHKKQLAEMDALVLAGKFHEAVDRFFHDSGAASSPGDDFKTHSKQEKKESLSHFLGHVKHTNSITLHSQTENGDVTESLFSFHFTSHHDHPLVWHEIIRRTWEDGLVVHEEYIMVEEPKAEAKKKTSPAKKTTKPKEEVTAPLTKQAKPKEVKKAVAVNADDLKKIEGIGPKIEELLHAAGIKSFVDLSSAPVPKVKGILDTAGPRFKMHDPSTWAKQAAMAAAGEWDKLKVWQDELNGGKAK